MKEILSRFIEMMKVSTKFFEEGDKIIFTIQECKGDGIDEHGIIIICEYLRFIWDFSK
jgi:hypothetical protein